MENPDNPAVRSAETTTRKPRFMTRPTARQCLDFLVIVAFGIVVWWLRSYGD